MKKDKKNADAASGAVNEKKSTVSYLVRVCAMILLVFWGSALLSPRSGFFTTLPILTVFSAAAALICFMPLRAAALAFASAFFAGLIGSLEPGRCALLGVSAAAGVTAAFWGVRLAARFFNTKKWIFALCAAALLLFAPAARLFRYGTPWDNIAAKSFFEKYLADKYPDQSFVSLSVSFSRRDGGYRAVVGFGGDGEPAEAVLTERDGEVSDGFFESFTLAGRDRVQSELVSLVRSRYAAEDLMIACPATDVGAGDMESFSGKFGSAPDWIHAHAVLELGFRFSLTGPDEFSRMAGEYFSFIRDSGFAFSRITFFGGDRGTYNYCVTLSPDADPASIPSLVTACSRSMEIPSIELS